MKSELVAVREPLCSVRTHDEHYSGDRISGQLDWMQLYEKMEKLVSSASLRSCCRRERAQISLRIAAGQSRACDPSSRSYRGLELLVDSSTMLDSAAFLAGG